MIYRIKRNDKMFFWVVSEASQNTEVCTEIYYEALNGHFTISVIRKHSHVTITYLTLVYTCSILVCPCNLYTL